jgi:TolA-binding protein
MASKHSASMLLLCLILVSLLTPLSFAGPSSQTIKAVAPDPAGLVGHYPFEGNAINTSGLGPAGNGILVGSPTYKAGVVGQAIALDGVDDSVNSGNGSLFNLTKQLTIAAWIKVNNFDKKHQTIISKGDNSWRLARAGDSDSIEFACNGTAATKWDGSGEVPWAVTGTTSVNDGKWHHVGGVFDGSALYLYIDGILEAAKAAGNSVDTSNYEVYIGENAQVPGRQWNGLIDDVRIHNYALSQAEIVSLMGKSQINLPEPVPATLYNIAKKYDGSRKYEEAKGVFELILKQYPGSSYASNAQIYLSKRNILALIESKDYTKAQAELDKLATDFVAHPELAEAMYAIAERYELPGKYEEAKSLYEQIVQLYPDSPYAGKARYDAPEIYIFSLIASGKYIEAQQAIDKFAVDFIDYPRVPGTLYWFAKRLDAAGKYEQARNIYQQVAWQYPDDAHATKALIEISKVDALSLIEAGDDTATQKVLDNLIADFSDHLDLPPAIFQIGDLYYNRAFQFKNQGLEAEAQGCFRKTIAIWERIIMQLPQSAITPQAYYMTARCYESIGELGYAVEYYQQVVDNWPNYGRVDSAYFLLARCFEKLARSGSIPEADAAIMIRYGCEKLLTDCPDSKPVKAARDLLKRWESGSSK